MIDFSKEIFNICQKLKRLLSQRRLSSVIIHNHDNYDDMLPATLASFILKELSIKSHFISNKDIELSNSTIVITPETIYKYYEVLEASNDKIVLNTISRDMYKWVRSYPNHQLIGDIFPFVKLSRSELHEFAKYLKVPSNVLDQYDPGKMNLVVNSVKITYLELEWAVSTNEQVKNKDGLGILESPLDPAKSPRWFMFPSSHKKILGALHENYKNTAYKDKYDIEKI